MRRKVVVYSLEQLHSPFSETFQGCIVKRSFCWGLEHVTEYQAQMCLQLFFQKRSWMFVWPSSSEVLQGVRVSPSLLIPLWECSVRDGEWWGQCCALVTLGIKALFSSRLDGKNPSSFSRAWADKAQAIPPAPVPVQGQEWVWPARSVCPRTP